MSIRKRSRGMPNGLVTPAMAPRPGWIKFCSSGGDFEFPEGASRIRE
jgi:hypothetical protein